MQKSSIKSLLFILFFCCNITSIKSQTVKDLKLIEEKALLNPLDLAYYKVNGNNSSFINTKNKDSTAKKNPAIYLFGSLLFFYQNVISKQLSKPCPYHTTCSNFSKKCIKEHGLLKGIFLTADRLSKCNRIANGDISLIDLYEDGTIKDNIINEY